MKLKTFFVENISEIITLDGQEFNHAINVFRLKLGDKIRIIDGKTDYEYIATISQINKKNLTVVVELKTKVNTNPNTNLSLFQAQLKNDKMEYIIQKATEIGVDSFVPFISENVVKTGDLNKDRIKQIAIESLKQSGRTRLLNIYGKLNFTELLKELTQFDLVLVAYEKATKNSKTLADVCPLLNKNLKVALIIGAEGGFNENEIIEIENVKTKIACFYMGERILRAETAAVTLSAIFLKEMGEYDE